LIIMADVTRNQTFSYAEKNVPPYGLEGQVLAKTSDAFYYTAWRDIDYLLDKYNASIDEGSY